MNWKQLSVVMMMAAACLAAAPGTMPGGGGGAATRPAAPVGRIPAVSLLSGLPAELRPRDGEAGRVAAQRAAWFERTGGVGAGKHITATIVVATGGTGISGAGKGKLKELGGELEGLPGWLAPEKPREGANGGRGTIAVGGGVTLECHFADMAAGAGAAGAGAAGAGKAAYVGDKVVVEGELAEGAAVQLTALLREDKSVHATGTVTLVNCRVISVTAKR